MSGIHASLVLALICGVFIFHPANARGTATMAAPIKTFASYCYEPGRLGGRPLPPDSTRGWKTLPDELRPRFNIPDDSAIRTWVWGGENDASMVLQLHERRLEKAGVHSGQMRLSCRLVINTPESDQQQLLTSLRALLGEHEGSTSDETLARLGYPTPEGWNQACWTIVARIGSTDWKPYRHAGRPTCVFLTTPRNYAVSQYIVIRLLSRKDDSVIIIEMDRTLRPGALEAP